MSGSANISLIINIKKSGGEKIMNKRIKLIALTVLSAVGMLAATSSAGACWLWALYQPECPKSLLK